MSRDHLQTSALERPYLFVIGLWVPVVLAAWTILVPSFMSHDALGWTAACGLALTTIVVGTLRSGRATRSIAHVLYETEHPPKTRMTV